MSEWTHDAATEIETVRAVLAAYAAGEIELPAPPKKANAAAMRYARHDRGTSPDHPYCAETLRAFLGWKIHKVQAALDVLGQQEAGLLDAETLGKLTTGQAEAVASAAGLGDASRIAKFNQPK